MCKQTVLKVGEKLQPSFLDALKNINKVKRQGNFIDYRENLSRLLGTRKRTVDEKYRRFLGGFILGEGSISVSLKRDKGTKLGVALDPQFNVTQHVNQCSSLLAILDVFQTGRIYHKSGSNATLVYVMDSRQSLQSKLVPFWAKYISPYQVGEEKRRITLFRGVLEALQEGKHRSAEGFVENLLPLWDSLRKQQGKSNESFADLLSARRFVLLGKGKIKNKGKRGF